MRRLLRLDPDTLKEIVDFLVPIVDEKVLEAAYRGEAVAGAKLVKNAIQEGVARIRKEQEKSERARQKLRNL